MSSGKHLSFDLSSKNGRRIKGQFDGGDISSDGGLMLFSDRTSAHRWWANQWRVLLSALAYTLLETVRRVGLPSTALAKAQCHKIRLKLVKVGVLIRRTKSRVRLHFASGYPDKEIFLQCLRRLRPT